MSLWSHKNNRGGLRRKGPLREVVCSENGFSMILVLMIMALLMVIGAEFVYSVRVESSSTRNFKDSVSAHGLALAGINMAITEILGEYDIVGLDEFGKLAFYSKEPNFTPPTRAETQFILGPGVVNYSIVDEKSKVDLNSAKREVIVELLRVTGQVDAPVDIIADSVLDWKDSNHEHHLNGAEDDYYAALPQPYTAKDGSFETVDELLLIRGMSNDIFYGVEGVSSGIGEYFTVFGSGKVNINTASELVLVAKFGRGRADEILLRRQTSGYFDRHAYGGVITSSIFSVRSVGTVMGLKVGIRAVIEKLGSTAAGSPKIKVKYWKELGTVAL